MQRISKLSPEGKFLKCWGKEGLEPGQFAPGAALALGWMACSTPRTPVIIACRCSRATASWCASSARAAANRGHLLYPYDLAFGPDGSLYVAEYGNHRVQKFTEEGESLGMVGGPGRGPGSCIRRGARRWTAGAASTWWTRRTIASSGSRF